MAQRYEGRLELTWTNKPLRLLADEEDNYEWVPPADYRATARLREQKRRAEAQRRRPLYWGDRIVRGVLAIPAYIVSRIVVTSVGKIDRSAWGLLLRLIGIVADVNI